MEKMDPRFTDPIEDAKAIKNCLTYLEKEARRVGLSAGADLIVAAGKAVEDAISLSERSVVFSHRAMSEDAEGVLPN